MVPLGWAACGLPLDFLPELAEFFLGLVLLTGALPLLAFSSFFLALVLPVA